MRHLGLLLCVAVGLTTAAAGEKTGDLERMQGSWVVASLVEKGQALPADDVKGLEVHVLGKKLTVKKDGKDISTYTLALDPKQRTLDLTADAGDDKGKIAPGIYQFEEQTLVIAADEQFKQRPAGFAAAETKTCSVITLKKKQ